MVPANTVGSGFAICAKTIVRGDKEFLYCDWHDEFEFIAVRGGNVCLQINGTYMDLEAGMAAFINCGEMHGLHYSAGSDPDIVSVRVHPGFLASESEVITSKYIAPLMGGKLPVFRSFSPDVPETKNITDNILSLYSVIEGKEEFYELYAKAVALNLFFSVLRTGRDAAYDADGKTARIKRVLAYINENYGSRIELSEMAALLDMSEGHFCRYFKQVMHRTPMDYLNGYRVARASSMLETTDSKIFDIAKSVGFNNFSHFINTFRRFTGSTPSEYRRLTSVYDEN